jgi:CBS domain containing-hemolysin-like protein
MTADPVKPTLGVATAAVDGTSGAASSSTLGWFATLRARLGLPGEPSLRETLEDALKSDDKSPGAFSAEERSMLVRLLRFGTLRVEDVMVPRADIIAADESETLGDLLRMFEDAGVSRIPLYHETLDDPRGMIHVKDLLKWMMSGPTGSTNGAASVPVDPTLPSELSKVDLNKPVSATKIRRQVLYVPPSMPAMNLLIRMQSTRIHMALVVDEYGGTDGLVTIEDLVEQIVGDIEDEHDELEDAHIHQDPKLGLVASARTPIQELERHLDLKLLTLEEEAAIDTLGGLVFALVGRVPSRGEIVLHPGGIEFEVLDADPRRVKRLKIIDTRSNRAGHAGPLVRTPAVDKA